MKTIVKISVLVLLIFSLHSCKKDKPTTPVVTTAEVTEISSTSATSGGETTNDGGAPILSKGICWSTTSDPAISNDLARETGGLGTYISHLTNLNSNTLYYVRAFATNIAGTSYGQNVSFTTSPPSVTDIDGNNYMIIQIGDQRWMNENLKTTKFNDGTDIPLVTNDNAWYYLSTPGYCWYGNSAETYKSDYGALYNWFAVNTGKLCPLGWSVPTDEDWTSLTTFLGSEAGRKLKETGTTHWLSPNDATNESGFTARAGGYRHFSKLFQYFGVDGLWWTSSQYIDLALAWSRALSNADPVIFRNTTESKNGLSVRCIKD